MKDSIEVNDQCIVQVRGYQESASTYRPGVIDPPCVTFEIGASCGARGTFGVHLSPENARLIGQALLDQAAKAEGRD